jgi:hypothetical protein
MHTLFTEKTPQSSVNQSRRFDVLPQRRDARQQDVLPVAGSRVRALTAAVSLPDPQEARNGDVAYRNALAAALDEGQYKPSLQSSSRGPSASARPLAGRYDLPPSPRSQLAGAAECFRAAQGGHRHLICRARFAGRNRHDRTHVLLAFSQGDGRDKPRADESAKAIDCKPMSPGG